MKKHEILGNLVTTRQLEHLDHERFPEDLPFQFQWKVDPRTGSVIYDNGLTWEYREYYLGDGEELSDQLRDYFTAEARRSWAIFKAENNR